MKILMIVLFGMLSVIGNAQIGVGSNGSYTDNIERNVVDIIDNTNIYVNDGDSQELFYYAIVPKESVVGILVLFPPTWQKAENVINHNIQLIEQTFSKNILVIIPSINYNLYLDEVSMSFVNQVFKDVLKRYAPPADKFIVGGFSLGGMNAIRYTEIAHENNMQTTIKPIAVFGVDPPLDFARLYHSFVRTIEKNFSQPAMNEAKDYIKKLDRQFGGAPEEFADVYVKNSMYSKSQKDGGNAKYLASVPIRIYCDPDIDWQLKNRRMDYYDMNAVDQTAMINHLLLMGNEEAEFINALGKGYRLDGRRHPHSWSLVEPEAGIEWMMKCLK